MAKPNGNPAKVALFLSTRHTHSQVCIVIALIHHLCQRNLATLFCTVRIFLLFCLGCKLKRVLSFHTNFEKDHFLFYKIHFSKKITGVMRIWGNNSVKLLGVSKRLACLEEIPVLKYNLSIFLILSTLNSHFQRERPS